mgnify:CR=1 FL=1
MDSFYDDAMTTARPVKADERASRAEMKFAGYYLNLGGVLLLLVGLVSYLKTASPGGFSAISSGTVETLLGAGLGLVLLVAGEVSDPDAVQPFLFAGQFNGLVPAFAAALSEKGNLALLAIEHLVDFIGAHGLVPVGIPLVLRALIEVPGGVAVEEGSTEGDAFHRVAVAATGAVTAGEDEFELAGAGLAKDGYCGTTLEAGFPAVTCDLLEDFLGVLFAVQPHEDLLDHGLLVLGVALDASFGDVPVVIDLEAQRVIEGEAHVLALFLGEGVVEGLYEGFASSLLLGLSPEGGKEAGGGKTSRRTGGRTEK